MKKRYLLFLISIVLLGALIYYSNPLKVYQTLIKTNPLYIGLGILFWFIGSIIRTSRWKYFLSRVNIDVSFLSAYKTYAAGLFISNLTPVKTGDPARAALLKKGEGKSFSKGLSAVFVERILDIFVLISISIPGLFLLAFSLNFSIWWVYIAIAFYATLCGGGIYILISKERTEKIFGKIVSIFSFIDKVEKLGEKVGKFSEKMSKSIRKYGDKKTLVKGLSLSYLVWFTNSILAHFAFLSVGVQIPIPIILVVMSTVTLLATLTFLPGSLGSGDIMTVGLYSGFIGANVTLITTGKLIGRFINYWLYALVGGIIIILFLKNIDIDEL